MCLGHKLTPLYFPFITNAHHVSFPLPIWCLKASKFSSNDKMLLSHSHPSQPGVRVAYLETPAHCDGFFLDGFFFWQY